MALASYASRGKQNVDSQRLLNEVLAMTKGYIQRPKLSNPVCFTDLRVHPKKITGKVQGS